MDESARGLIGLNHDSRSPGRKVNPRPPEHEAGVLTTCRNVRHSRRREDFREIMCEDVDRVPLPQNSVPQPVCRKFL
jgi:hypothetical protein